MSIQDALSPAEVVRDELRSAGLVEPTLTELVVALRDLPEGPQRHQLEDWYWAFALERHGPVRDSHWKEYEWLRAHR